MLKDMQFDNESKCRVCGWRDASPFYFDKREEVCGVCAYLIPRHIPQAQYKKYICSILLKEYNYTITYSNGEMTKSSSDKILWIVSGLITNSLGDPPALS